MNEAWRLLSEFNAHRNKTAAIRKLRASGKCIPPLAFRQKHLDAMGNMAQWCRDNGIEPFHWLHSLFEMKCWITPPKLTELCSKKMLKKYKTFQNKNFKITENARARTEQDDYDPNRDITGTVENLKRHYLHTGQAQVCQDSLRLTLGFHPRSTVCAICPLQNPCKEALQQYVGFDIQALRRGEISATQAEVDAKAGVLKHARS